LISLLASLSSYSYEESKIKNKIKIVREKIGQHGCGLGKTSPFA
jgi:hypothetical protein